MSSNFHVQVFPTVFGFKPDVVAGNKEETNTGYHVYVTGVDTGFSVTNKEFLNVNGLKGTS